VRLLILEREGLGGLHQCPDHRENQDQQPLLATLRKALDAQEKNDGEVFEDRDEPGGASQGGPVHAAQVTKYDRHRARDGRDDDQHERGVHHVRRVLGVLGAEDEGGLDDEGDPGEHQAEGDHLENATSLLEEDAGEEGHTDWSDRGNHGHVC